MASEYRMITVTDVYGRGILCKMPAQEVEYLLGQQDAGAWGQHGPFFEFDDDAPNPPFQRCKEKMEIIGDIDNPARTVYICRCYSADCQRGGRCRHVSPREAIQAADAWWHSREELPGWRCVLAGGMNFSEPQVGEILLRNRDGRAYGVACGETGAILVPAAT